MRWASSPDDGANQRDWASDTGQRSSSTFCFHDCLCPQASPNPEESLSPARPARLPIWFSTQTRKAGRRYPARRWPGHCGIWNVASMAMRRRGRCSEPAAAKRQPYRGRCPGQPGLGTRLQASRPGGREVRALTKINRVRAAAEDNTLRIEEVLPAGTRFEAFLRWDDAAAGEVAGLAAKLAGWRPLIGRGSAAAVAGARSSRSGTERCTWTRRRSAALANINGPELARETANARSSRCAPPGSRMTCRRACCTVHGVDRRSMADRQRAEARKWPTAPGDRDSAAAGQRGVGSPRVRGQGAVPVRAEFILRSVGPSRGRASQRCGDAGPARYSGIGGGQDGVRRSGTRAVRSGSRTRSSRARLEPPQRTWRSTGSPAASCPARCTRPKRWRRDVHDQRPSRQRIGARRGTVDPSRATAGAGRPQRQDNRDGRRRARGYGSVEVEASARPRRRADFPERESRRTLRKRDER